MCYSPAAGIDAWLLLPALVAVVLTISSCLRREGTSAARLAAIKSASCVELGPAAVADALSVGALSTINVYRGDIGAEALAHLKKNLKSLLEHNPWLAGTLAPSVHTGAPIALYVPHLGDVHVQDVLAEAVEPKLTPELPYAELCKIGAKYAVDRGVPAAPPGRTRGQVFGVAALHGAEGECAALCVSLSHTVADVHTFYKVRREESRRCCAPCFALLLARSVADRPPPSSPTLLGVPDARGRGAGRALRRGAPPARFAARRRAHGVGAQRPALRAPPPLAPPARRGRRPAQAGCKGDPRAQGRARADG